MPRKWASKAAGLVTLEAECAKPVDHALPDLLWGHPVLQGQVPPNELEDRAVRNRLAIRDARSLELEDALPIQAPQELVDQPGLADAGLADQHHDRAVASGRLPEPGGQPFELEIASDEGGQPSLSRHLQPCPSRQFRRHGPHPDRLGLPLDRELAEVGEIEIAVGQAMRVRAERDLSGLGDVQDPRGQIGGIAHRRVVHAKVTPDGTHHHRTGIDADPDPEVDTVTLLHVIAKRLQAGPDAQRRAQRAMRVVLVGDRGAEERHHAVAEKLVDGPLVRMDGGEDDLEASIHDFVDGLGIESGRQRGEAGDIREQHGDLLALALDGARRDEDLLGQMLRCVRVRRGEAVLDRSSRRRLPRSSGPGVDGERPERIEDGVRQRGRGAGATRPGGRGGIRGQALPAFVTELARRGVRRTTGEADQPEARTALAAELGRLRVVVAALRTAHASGPRV
jgi:hypothetical protein